MINIYNIYVIFMYMHMYILYVYIYIYIYIYKTYAFASIQVYWRSESISYFFISNKLYILSFSIILNCLTKHWTVYTDLYQIFCFGSIFSIQTTVWFQLCALFKFYGFVYVF